MSSSTFRNALSWGRTFTVTVACVIALEDSILGIDTVKGSSMSPTLSPSSTTTGVNDRVLIKRFQPTQNLHRGDVVTFWKPHTPNEISIKRIVALPGDEVWPRDRAEGTKGGYGGHGVRGNYFDIEGAGDGSVGGKGESLIVPVGHVWVEGDNWRGSFDSNDFGPISKALIDGKALRVWRGGWWRGIERVREKKGEVVTRVAEGEERMAPYFEV